MNERLRIVVSAYACEPGRGSEPGVGWNWVRQIARHNDAWVITRQNHRAAIQAHPELPPNARFVYFDLPRWARFWKRGKRGLYLYYYLWQIGAWLKARQLHRTVQFHIAHHVTFVTYWMPSFLALLPIPFVWGPVGGGESAPRSFLRTFPLRGIAFEWLRSAAQALGRRDPFVRLAARRSALAFASTPETAERIAALGCRRVELLSAMGLSAAELDRWSRHSACHCFHTGGAGPRPAAASRAALPDKPSAGRPFRFLGMGDLLHWKGCELGLRAFARAFPNHPNAEYWFIGEGIERRRLERLARELHVAPRVKFWGQLPREAALARLAECHVLVHPSLHDSGGCVVAEALAAGRPVICLDLGGPALQVTAGAGFKIPAHSPAETIADLANAMQQLASNADLYARMSHAAQRHARTHLAWNRKGDQMAGIYRELAHT